ncbi:metallophosphoesterase [Pleurocapsales cyanobacterium LEGE 10410]|nr:metallophosphoesterase [Pleurocapsales cyanobacterium LEGE 10410]
MKRYIWLFSVGFIISVCFGCVWLDRRVELADNITATPAIIEDLYIPPRKDFRIVVISDLNSQYGSTEYEPEVKQAIALIPQWQPDLVLCSGDMIAGQKASLTKKQIQSMWAAFDRHVAAPLRDYGIPFAFTIGNHDGSGAIKDRTLIFEQERDLARRYWHREQQQLGLDFVDRANFPFYYSFQQDGIFFLVWDASTQNISKQQLAWVKQTLNTSAAQQTTTRIAIGHLPLYPIAAAKDKPGEYLADGSQLRSLLEQNQVELYVSGHHHAYYPGKIGELKLLHAGALGQGARQLIDSDLLPTQTITVLDLDVTTSQLAYTTYDAKTWELISLNQLPTSIPSYDGEILRDDM